VHFEEQVIAPVGQPAAWEFLWQTQRLAACLPGCKSVEELEPGKRYRAAFEDSVGPYQVHFDIDVTVEGSDPQTSVHLKAFGEDRRIGASQTVDLRVSLEPLSASETKIAIVAEVQLLGKIATLGQFLIKRKVKQVVADFALNVRTELERSADPVGGPNG
jgi:carbon monoxide dehydrogenase subunit G